MLAFVSFAKLIKNYSINVGKTSLERKNPLWILKPERVDFFKKMNAAIAPPNCSVLRNFENLAPPSLRLIVQCFAILKIWRRHRSA
ncbi:MAG: hypothetical protein COZ75_13270 [Flavobacteriaceae bacterium CG_4_8_14_3_um_filter_34_10]|nr:MAG: hypothetical protein COZ75_13270 [Flavobacteriaceae bacterium CG_4_8_14_3_um_filter_34_10]PIZ07151.1 MAG: hypothetical protein COY56_10520 [Flavobacteriaceae bacterium CG_4_10_14_0_8_um_filter_34_31]